jgi:hypothetical protein
MVESASLSTPFLLALGHLQTNGRPGVRVDSVCENFAYVWIGDLQKQKIDEKPGGWIRIPTAFPFGNPHGLITIAPLTRQDGTLVADGHNPGHQMCNPVQVLGGAHYYSWTWQDCPTIRDPQDIIGVLHWYERRIRRG